MEKTFFLERESLAEIKTSDVGVIDQLARGSTLEDLSLRHYVGAVGDAKGFPDIMVGYQDADALVFQIKDQIPNVVYRERIDASERLIEQYEPGFGRKTSGDLHTSAFAA